MAGHPIAESIRAAYRRIESVRSAAGMVAVCRELREAAVALYEEGLRSERLTAVIAQWNDAVLQRLLELHAGDFEGLRWCWMALGSEGRLEQTLATDQDNALIFEHSEPENLRKRLLPVLERINTELDDCGYAWCKGGVMASNPQWCLSLDEWQENFARWIDIGDPQSLLHGAIFFDFRGIAGDTALVDQLRAWLSGYIRPRPLFLKMLAAQSLENHPPLTLWHSLRGRRLEGHKVLDIKLNGVSLLVDAARIFALAAGVAETSTPERFAQAARTAEDRANAAAWRAAYHWLQDLRIRHQFDQILDTGEADNMVRLDELSRFDRRTLIAALLEADRVQQSLRIRYQL